MAASTERPIIFPLSNPTDNAECTAEDCFAVTQGKAIFASGSPFEPVMFNGKSYTISQCNNMFIFPGLGLGATLGKCKAVSDGMIHRSSLSLAASLTQAERNRGQIFPSVSRIRDVSLQVASGVIRQAAAEGLIHPTQLDILPDLEEEGALEAYVRNKMYDPVYVPMIDSFSNRQM